MEPTRDVGAVGTGLWDSRQTVPEGRPGVGADFLLFLAALAARKAYYDPACNRGVASSARRSNRRRPAQNIEERRDDSKHDSDLALGRPSSGS